MKLANNSRLKLLRRISHRGLSQCLDALRRSDDNVLVAARSLMTGNQILEAYQSLRIRISAASSIKDPPSPEERDLVEQLYQEVKPSASDTEQASLFCKPPPTLPSGFPSYQALVVRILELDASSQDFESLVEKVAALGFSADDAEYILDRVGGGTFRGRMDPKNCPDSINDPIAFAAYRLQRPRRWWHFWRR